MFVLPGTPIFETVLRMFIEHETYLPASPIERGAEFFRNLKLFRLDKQQRATDALQADTITQLRTFDPLVYPITKPLMDRYKTMTAEDVRSSSRWDNTPTVVPLNILRHEYNKIRMIIYAKSYGQPILCWRNIPTGKEAGGLSQEELNLLFASHPALCGYFILGMVVFLNDNINVKKR